MFLLVNGHYLLLQCSDKNPATVFSSFKNLQKNLSAFFKWVLIPVSRSACLIFNHARLKKVALFFQINHLAHPRKRIFFILCKEKRDADLPAAPVANKAQIFFEHQCIQSQYAARHRIFRITVFEIDRLTEQFTYLSAEMARPQMRICQLDLVDEIDAKIAMKRFIAQDVLILLGGAGHFVLPPYSQNLRKTDIENQTFHHAREHDQRS